MQQMWKKNINHAGGDSTIQNIVWPVDANTESQAEDDSTGRPYIQPVNIETEPILVDSSTGGLGVCPKIKK